MKRAKNLIIMAVVLALLIGAYIIATSIAKKNEADETVEETVSYTVTELDAETLSSLKVKITETGDSETTVTELSFALSSDSTKWLWSEDESVPLDNQAFADIVTSINESTSAVKMENVTDEELTSYGLDNPHIEVTFGFSDGSGYTAKLGNYNSFNSQYYYTDSNEAGTVYMVDSTVGDALEVSIFDLLLYDELPEITSSDIISLTYTKGDNKIVYTYYPNGKSTDYTDTYHWYASVNGGTEFAVSSTLGDDIASAVTSMSLYDAVTYNKEKDSTYGLDNPGTLVIAYNKTETVEDSTTGTSTDVTRATSYTLYFGGQDEDAYYYVRTPDSNLVYILTYSDTFYDMFEGDTTDLRPTELLSVNDSYVDEVIYTAGSDKLDVVLTHADGTTAYAKASGDTLDFDKYNAIATKLAEITATSYTTLVERDTSVGTDLIFSAEYKFNTGDAASGTLEIRKYSQAYAQVSFMGRDDQLITLDEANELVSLLNEAQ